jgi:hypothetical protein
MITENIKCVRSYATSGYVYNTGKKFAGDLIHVGDHKEKALRSGIGGSESTSCERAVNGTGSAALRLHFYNLNSLTENILSAFSGPLIGNFRHRRRGSDGINAGNFSKRIRHVSRSCVTVH